VKRPDVEVASLKRKRPSPGTWEGGYQLTAPPELAEGRGSRLRMSNHNKAESKLQDTAAN